MMETTNREQIVFYRVPVAVTVDLDEGTVESVAVWDKAVEEDANYAGSPGERVRMTEAYAIAAETDWPAWTHERP